MYSLLLALQSLIPPDPLARQTKTTHKLINWKPALHKLFTHTFLSMWI